MSKLLKWRQLFCVGVRNASSCVKPSIGFCLCCWSLHQLGWIRGEFELVRTCGWNLHCNFDRWQFEKWQFPSLSKSLDVPLTITCAFSMRSDVTQQVTLEVVSGLYPMNTGADRKIAEDIVNIWCLYSYAATQPGSVEPYGGNLNCPMCWFQQGLWGEFSNSLSKSPFSSSFTPRAKCCLSGCWGCVYVTWTVRTVVQVVLAESHVINI